MSSILGSAASLSRSAGGLSAGLQERNRYWMLFLEGRLAAVEGKMRASGELGSSGHPPRDLVAGNDAALPAGFAADQAVDGAPAATPGAAWNWPGTAFGANYSVEESE